MADGARGRGERQRGTEREAAPRRLRAWWSLICQRFGEAWKGTVEGRTALTGDIPVNTDGGLLAMGHPFGASGIRMIHETVTQLRGEAGTRQVANARVGVAQCSGAGDVTTVHILRRG